jgi:hypothetical protein
MMALLKTLRLTSWCVAALMTAASVAQGSPQVGPDAKKARDASAPPWLQKTIRFSDEKVILGLPQENDRSVTYCSDAGTTFVDLYGASSDSGLLAIPELFSISATAGEVNPQQRLFEVNSHNGSLLKEFLFDKPRLDAVKCASASRLTAIFYDTIADAVHPVAASTDQAKTTESATQLVIATAPR